MLQGWISDVWCAHAGRAGNGQEADAGECGCDNAHDAAGAASRLCAQAQAACQQACPPGPLAPVTNALNLAGMLLVFVFPMPHWQFWIG